LLTHFNFCDNCVMGYFNYHAKAKNKIKEGKLKHFEIVERWNKISPAMVLYFSDGEIITIRDYRFQEYLDIINDIKK